MEKDLNYLASLKQAYLKHDWKSEHHINSDEEGPGGKVPLVKYNEIESKLIKLKNDLKSHQLDSETNLQIQASTIKILKETIEKYKSHIEKLLKSNERKMKKILVFDHFIKEYCKDSELDIKLNPNEESENLLQLQLESLQLRFEEQTRILKENHEQELKKYQEKITEILELLKKEKIKSRKLTETANKAIEFMKRNQENFRAKEENEINLIRGSGSGKALRKIMKGKNKDLGFIVLNELKGLKEDLAGFKDYVQKICEKFPLVIGKVVKEQVLSYSRKFGISEEIGEKFGELMKENKELAKRLNEIRGNIRVVCRVRPLLSLDEKSCVETSDRRIILQHPYMKTTKVWDFDKVFDKSSSQLDVFFEIKDLIYSSFDGYNVCIFTYGQTGSGKTYTLEGPEENPGLIKNICQEIFKQKSIRVSWEYQIKLSVIEIYNEDIRDLLDDGKSKPKIIKGKVADIHKRKVNTIEKMLQYIEIGCKSRYTCSNSININSSRSHLILTLHIKAKCESCKFSSQIRLVDLAGSERLSKSHNKSEQLAETKHINLSLHVLGSVISAKNQNNSHVPYRNSILTQVLQNSLSGDSKVLMIAQISPEIHNYDESVSSLNFAATTKSTSLGVPKTTLVNISSNF